MKIDRSNFRHWLRLARFVLNVSIAIIIRPFFNRANVPLVILYGHKLCGNLLAIYEHVEETRKGISLTFLTMDPVYHRRLISEGRKSLLAISARSIMTLARAHAIISDHGLHAMQPMVRWSSLKFFDVWHGIPFKGFDAVDFSFQHGFTEIWVASPLHKGLYVGRFGFSPDRVQITGYARTDRLVFPNESHEEVRRELSLPIQTPTVLFAPTWKQDERGRSIFPFGCEEEEFFRAVSQVTAEYGAKLLMRAHLNSGLGSGSASASVVSVPQGQFPDTEKVLLASDILICDWSSIAFDYLLLDRPTIFLGVPHPFKKGLSLGEEYRFGPVVKDLEGLLDTLRSCLSDRVCYWQRYGPKHQQIKTRIYGQYADGQSAARCIEQLMRHLPSTGSSQ